MWVVSRSWKRQGNEFYLSLWKRRWPCWYLDFSPVRPLAYSHFLGGPMVKNLLSNAADVDSIPGWGTKIPHDSAKTSLVAQMVKASAYNAGDWGSIPGLGRSPGEGNGNPLQYSCLENLMDREAWWGAVHGVTKSRTRLSDFTSFHFFS